MENFELVTEKMMESLGISKAQMGMNLVAVAEPSFNTL